MAKIKTSQLIGEALDLMVATLQNLPIRFDPMGFKSGSEAGFWVWEEGMPGGKGRMWKIGRQYSPSTNWMQAGPIIEQEAISPMYEPSQVYDDSARWKAMGAFSDAELQYGPTPLIAVMRAYVAAKMGEEVDVPDELIQNQ